MEPEEFTVTVKITFKIRGIHRWKANTTRLLNLKRTQIAVSAIPPKLSRTELVCCVHATEKEIAISFFYDTDMWASYTSCPC